MNEFQEATDVLHGELAARRAYERAFNRKCDWNDPDDVAEFRSWAARRGRERLLQSLRPEKTCDCGQTLHDIKSWVISPRKALCRSCYFRGVHNPRKDPQYYPTQIFTEPELRVRIDPRALENAREAAGLSMREFARRAGWSRPYQSKLEGGHVQTIALEVAFVIRETLREAALEIDDILPEVCYPQESSGRFSNLGVTDQ